MRSWALFPRLSVERVTYVCVEDEVGFGERRVLKKEGNTMGVDELMEWRWREKAGCFIRVYSASA